MKHVVVIGGGASGLMAAYAAAKNGNAVTLIEKNEKLGKKIYITGKGRCNLTNDCPPDEFLQNVVHGQKFLTGAVYSFPPQSTMEFMEAFGLPLKTERGNRVFPASDKASDVTKTLENACRSVGVSIQLKEKVLEIQTLQGNVCGVISDKGRYPCDCAIVCTGGVSYPSTGSTGDGYRFAREIGHEIVSPVPSLTGLNLKGNFTSVQGISLKNAVLSAERNGKVIYSRMGELLFTHYGISGPLVLSLSAEINRLPMNEIALYLDFKPALDEKKLDERLVRDLSEKRNERMKNVARGLLPLNLALLTLNQAGISAEKQANALTKEERRRYVSVLKRYPLSPVGVRGFDEAVVTSGGVDLRQINPKTMESKLAGGLYFCGEVLDIDAYTGGFNLQIAFSSAFAAGNSIK